MKRSRDDVFVSSLRIKRPAISPRIEQSGQVQMSTASSPHNLTTTDALSYLKNVKEIFQDRRDKYDDFLDVMKDFKAQRIDTPGVILRVKELFKGNRDLILGFNTFLPKGYGITLPLEDEPFLKKKPVEFDEALGFVNKIKTRFQGDDVYKAFLGILNMYRKGNKSITEVYQEVAVLFQDHADLLVEFTHFLPETSGVSFQYAQSGRNNIVHGDDRGSPMTITRSTQVDKKPALCDEHDTEHYEKEKEKGEDTERNEWELDYSIGHKRKSAHRDDSAINQFRRGITEMEADFRDKVKDQLQDPEIEEKFSDCIRSFKSKFFDAAQFRMLVTSLLGTHRYVSEACEAFITYVERNGSLRNNKLVFRPLKVDRDGDDHDREDREKNKDHDFRERDIHDRGLPLNTKDIIGQRMLSYASREKFMSKSIQDLDLSNSDRCSPSYRLLPENYPVPSASCRTEIGAKVLNDYWVSFTSGSEDYSFKHMRKNQYEESLSRCEDDRFELDMLLESVNATTKRVEELLDSMNAHAYKMETTFSIKDHLSVLHMRCIERLYGDHGLDVMDVLRKNAPLALPVILMRLKQKQEEWETCRADFNKVWAEIYAKNYHKSLDHRSFYFKQQDTKNLSAKALLSEIKEMSEKNQNEDGTVLSVAAGYTEPTKPHLEFDYPDVNIHKDIYQLMKYSCGEVCTPEQRDKVMNIWTTFLELFLGVPSSPPSAWEEKRTIKAKNYSNQNLEDTSQENSSRADEVPHCKPADMSKSGDEDIPPEDSFPSRAGMACGNNGNVSDDSPGADNVGDKIGLLCKASPTAAGENDVNKENASASCQEAGHTNADCGMEVVPSQESQDGAIMKPTTCSNEMVMEDSNAQKHRIENETHSKGEQEEGGLSPNRNLVENSCVASRNSENEIGVGEIGEDQVCSDEAEEETDVNGADEGEESGHVSSESEDASEEGDGSGNESADGEEGSREEPGEDEDNDENEKKDESEQEVDCLPDSDSLLEKMKPLTVNVPPALKGKEKDSHIFYGNDSFYLLFRLHHMLYERMQTAKFHSSSPENKWRASNDAHSEDSYARFKDALHCLLNGSSDNAKFEDECRALIGSQSYILFTLDKLIHKLVKQLQLIASEEMDTRLLHLYAYERSRSPEAFADLVYHENARFLLLKDNLYRIEFLPGSLRLTVQLMKNELDKLDPIAVSMDPYFTSYLNDELLLAPENETPGVFLKRSKTLYSSEDEYSDTAKVMEGLVIHNGLEVKVNCNSLRMSYVFDTEDFVYRPRKRRRALYGGGASDEDGCALVAKRRELMSNWLSTRLAEA